MVGDELDRWPSADTDTRLVFITRNISAEVIRGLFAAVGAVAGDLLPIGRTVEK